VARLAVVARRTTRNSKAFEKIANVRARNAARGKKPAFYAAGQRQAGMERRGGAAWQAEDLSGSKGEQKFLHVLRQFPRRSDEGVLHAYGRGISHARGNLKKFEAAAEILDAAR
jgi:hypothetical protein